LVVFRVKSDIFGVLYPLDDLRAGVNTREPCDTPREWAEEIGWDIDEQVLTGGLLRAHRAPAPDGLVLLRWRLW
jgi:hypothetical protein